MLDTKTYKRILEEIDSGNIDKLKDFLKEDYVKTYKDNPDISALIDYCKNHFPEAGYSFIYNDKSLLTTYDSLFYLKDRELITEYELITGKQLREITNPSLTDLLELMKKAVVCIGEYSRVISMESTYQPEDSKYAQLRIRSTTDTIGQCIRKDAIDFSKAILGNDTIFKLKNGKPELFGESEKGKVLILGIGSTSKQ